MHDLHGVRVSRVIIAVHGPISTPILSPTRFVDGRLNESAFHHPFHSREDTGAVQFMCDHQAVSGHEKNEVRSPVHVEPSSSGEKKSGSRRLFHLGSKFRRSDHESRPLITNAVVFYATMFGSAEQYARTLAHSISSQTNASATVNDLESFDGASITEQLTATRLFVFVVSTHFAGAPSPSGRRFCDWINHLISARHCDAGHQIGTVQSLPYSSTLPLAHSSAKNNWLGIAQWLRRHQKPLRGMMFTVFGVGDSVYEKFNAMGKFVDAKLKLLGAKSFHPLGLGDCSNDLELMFQSWKASLLGRFPPPSDCLILDTVSEESTKATTTLNISALSSSRITSFSSSTGESQLNKERRSSKNAAITPSPFLTSLTVRDNFGRQLRLRFRCRILRSEPTTDRTISRPSEPRTPRVALFDDIPFARVEPHGCFGGTSHLRSSREHPQEQCSKAEICIFRVHLLNSDITYTTVSTLALFPRNNTEVVERLAEAFCFDLNARLELYIDENDRSRDISQLPFPTPCTVRTALTEFVELMTVTRDFVRVASGYVVTNDEREMLETLSSTDAFETVIAKNYKSVLDVVAMAPTLQIPLEVLLNISQPIRPRYFTIASSPLVSPRSFEIAVSLGHPDQPRGLAVSFLAEILKSATDTHISIRGFINPSRINFVGDGHSPTVFIATGVGISAMRAVLQERFAKFVQKQYPSSPKQILFLGAPNEESIVFRDDLRLWEQKMFLTVHYAFSNGTRWARQHVQEVVASRIDEIYLTVKSSANSRILVCGQIAMVRRLCEIFKADQLRRSGCWFDDILSSGRFIEEGFA